MADNYETMNQESPNYGCFKEAVCIDASRVYDSCGDKDCLEDLRVYFSPASQAVIDQAAQVRMRNVDVLVVYLGLEPVPFHKGFYSVDMTFFFEVTLDVFQTPAAPPVTISGLSVAISYYYVGIRRGLFSLPYSFLSSYLRSETRCTPR